MSIDLHFHPDQRDVLTHAGLGDFRTLISTTQGRCVSWHARGQTYRIQLPDGRTVYLKRDVRTSLKNIVGDLTCLHACQSACVWERISIERVGKLGVPVPEALAWGIRRRWRLPHQAVLVMGELGGTPLHKFYRTQPPRALRHRALRLAAETIARIYDAGLSWPDVRPKHIHIPDDLDAEPAGVLDLERMRRARLPRRTYAPQQIRRFCERLRYRGADDRDVSVFREALRESEIPAS